MKEVTIYYKNVTIDGKRFRIITPAPMSNEAFTEIVTWIRRIFGYSMYPRWVCTRMLLGETLDILRKNKLFKHRIKGKANILTKEFDAFERLHTIDFDEDWIEVMSGHVAMQLQPKVNALRGALGGLMMKHGIKNYILYSYPQDILILCREGAEYYDALMAKVKEKFGLDFSEVFKPLRGDNVLGCAQQLMSAIEDALGEKLPTGVDATGTTAEVALESLERAFYDADLLAAAFKEADEECDERDFGDEAMVNQLSTKYNVKRL